jgi:hypothetical protein
MKSDCQDSVIKDGIRDTSEAIRGKDIIYRCKQCRDVISSVPIESVGCRCGNIFIDVDYHKLAVRECADFQILRKPYQRKRTSKASN